MKNENLNMDKVFREKLDGFSTQPPPLVWDNIKGQLADQKLKRRTAYFGWISAAAVVVLAFMAGWYFNNNSENTAPLGAESNIIQSEPGRDKNDIKEENPLSTGLVHTQKSESENNNNTVVHDSFTSLTASRKTDISGEEISTGYASRGVEVKRMKSIAFQFENEKIELLLAENNIAKNESLLTETDKNLIVANSSNESSKNNRENGWKMGVYVAPGYSSHVASHSESYSQNMNYTDKTGNSNVGGGFSVQYKTSKKLSLESGIYYAQNGQKTGNSFELLASNDNMYDAFSGPEYSTGQSIVRVSGFSNVVNVSSGGMLMNSTAGVVKMSETPEGVQITAEMDTYNKSFTNNLVSDGEFSQVFDFVEIPLYLRYRIVDSKFGLELLGGLNAGIVVGNNAYIDNTYGTQNIGETQDISSLNLSGTLGVGLNYSLGKHISVAVEPRVNYYLNSINTNSEVSYRPYRIGFYTGLYYDF